MKLKFDSATHSVTHITFPLDITMRIVAAADQVQCRIVHQEPAPKYQIFIEYFKTNPLEHFINN